MLRAALRSSVDHCIDGSNLIPKRSAKQRFRQQIFEAWNYQCAYCGIEADTLDHVKPRHKGGDTITTNLVPACKDCNRRKGSEDWQEWFKQQESYLLDREQAVMRWIQSSGDRTP
jgi:5-methylcytosine-specific restriction endonuclease McrA